MTPRPRLHTLDFGPEDLPPVLPKDLRRSWHAAHVGAEVGLVMAPGDVEGVVFRRGGVGRGRGDETRFLFSDLDGACWAAAVDRLYSLSSTQGISLLFRLLALIELMSDTPWLRPFFSLSRAEGAVLDAKLIAVAAAQPLSATASFEPGAFKVAMGLAEAPLAKRISANLKSPARRKAAREGTRRGSARGTRPT
ncbi:MAG: hypothetical protein SFV19_06330 [Rhodospirillaceae bacterium]|nr:hypothetical protein [Rhodospirillaceae bacterium]